MNDFYIDELKLSQLNKRFYKLETEKNISMNEQLNYALKNWKDINYFSNELIIYAYKNNTLDILLSNKKFTDKIINSPIPLIHLKNFTHHSSDIYNKILTKIKNDEIYCLNQIIDFTIKKDIIEEIDEQQLQLLKEIFYLIIKEISKNEKTPIYNLQLIGQGQFSDVYLLNNKIIKLGTTRLTTTFPNNPYIIKPLLRKKFPIDDQNNSLFIEVCEKIKTDCCEFEDVKKLYNKLRTLGLVWMDPKKSNIGKLINDNQIYWQKNLKPCDKALLLDTYRGTDKLKAGDAIICDADYIYDENNPKVDFNRVRDFELSYRLEKRLTKRT